MIRRERSRSVRERVENDPTVASLQPSLERKEVPQCRYARECGDPESDVAMRLKPWCEAEEDDAHGDIGEWARECVGDGVASIDSRERLCEPGSPSIRKDWVELEHETAQAPSETGRFDADTYADESVGCHQSPARMPQFVNENNEGSSDDEGDEYRQHSLGID